jgi:hypothetical protein
MKDIIAITGYAGSMKCQATFIAQSLFPEAKRIDIAKNLKKVLGKVFQIGQDNFYLNHLKDIDFEDPIYLTPELIDSTLRLYGIEAEYHDFKKFVGKMIYKPRELMDFMGTEVLQSFDKQIHIKREFLIADKADMYIVSDLKFLHELEYLRENSQTLQVLFMSNDVALQNAALRKSVSEVEIHKVAKSAIHVDSNGSLESLRFNIEKYIKV